MDTAESAGSGRAHLARPRRRAAPGGRSRLITEISAGVTLAALSLPLNIGYAESAGLPVIVGINAAIIPVIALALFSGSCQPGFRSGRDHRRAARRSHPGARRRDR
ncbi:MAG: SulP family inorganic anion transporter [Acidimicrobiia bacterium]|nr:SulP family inorganic anion transporter [Acidimicrobiia bacterium]